MFFCRWQKIVVWMESELHPNITPPNALRYGGGIKPLENVMIKVYKVKIHVAFLRWPTSAICFYYQYHPSRSHDVALNFFEDYNGYLHCDGYSAYDALAEKRPITLVGCLYHVRRKYMEVIKLSPNQEGVASYVVKLIAKLSVVVEEIKLFPPENKKILREEKAKPILNVLGTNQSCGKRLVVALPIDNKPITIANNTMKVII